MSSSIFKTAVSRNKSLPIGLLPEKRKDRARQRSKDLEAEGGGRVLLGSGRGTQAAVCLYSVSLP